VWHWLRCGPAGAGETGEHRLRQVAWFGWRSKDAIFPFSALPTQDAATAAAVLEVRREHGRRIAEVRGKDFFPAVTVVTGLGADRLEE
jgi:hypothetical protein